MKEEFKQTPETEIAEENKVANLFDEMEGKLEEMEKEIEKKEIGPEGQEDYVTQDEIDSLLSGYFHKLKGVAPTVELATGNKYGQDKIVISPDNRGLLEKNITRYEEGATSTYELLEPKRTARLLKESADKFSQEIEKLEEKKRKCEAILEKIREKK